MLYILIHNGNNTAIIAPTINVLKYPDGNLAACNNPPAAYASGNAKKQRTESSKYLS